LPAASTSTARVRPVSRCLTVTIAPGTAAPEVSFTVPAMAAAKPCARTGQSPKAIKLTNVMTVAISLISTNWLLAVLFATALPPCGMQLLTPEPRSQPKFRLAPELQRQAPNAYECP